MTSDRRPNIVFGITDQQRRDTIAAAGFPSMETPSLDRMVREGVCFTHDGINTVTYFFVTWFPGSRDRRAEAATAVAPASPGPGPS